MEAAQANAIKDIPPLGWGKGRECTFAGALEAALAVTEHPADYDQIMGDTGLAFRVRWYQDSGTLRWCPSSAVGEFPDEIAAAGRSTGWELKYAEELKSGPGITRWMDDVRESIDRGIPVLGYGPDHNMAVLRGYEEGGSVVLTREYGSGGATARHAPEHLMAFVIWPGKHSDPEPSKKMFLHGLETGVKNWDREPESAGAHGGSYLYGRQALLGWSEDIGLYDSLSEEDRNKLFFVSWWNFSSLMDARAAGVRYLRARSSMLNGDAAESIEAAANHYDQEHSELQAAAAEADAFLGPWTGKTIAQWSEQVRSKEQALLLRAAQIEGKAIRRLREALETATPSES